MSVRKGSTNEDERKRKETRNSWRGDSDSADWGTVEPAAIHAAVVAASSNGWAIRFGYTRDGGAFTIGILGDGDPYTEYIRPTEDIHVALFRLTEYARAT